MLDQMTGPLAVFDGVMATPCTRKAIAIEVIEPATFSVLEMEFPATDPAEMVPPATTLPNLAPFTAPTYPELFKLIGVKRFQLASGTIMVSFRA